MNRNVIAMSVVVALAVLGLAAGAQARVTEKVDAMIAENSPLKVNDNDMWIQVGYPLVLGLEYNKYATANLVLGGGAGSFLNGTTLDLVIKYLFLTGKFSPYISAGPVLYFRDADKNFFGIYGTAGVQYMFDGGLGFSLAGTYVSALSDSPQPFGYPWVNDELNQASVQFGFHWNY